LFCFASIFVYTYVHFHITVITPSLCHFNRLITGFGTAQEAAFQEAQSIKAKKMKSLQGNYKEYSRTLEKIPSLTMPSFTFKKQSGQILDLVKLTE